MLKMIFSIIFPQLMELLKKSKISACLFHHQYLKIYYYKMCEKLPSTPYKWHFLCYCISLIGCGAVITGLGPLLPFLAEIQHQDATQFSFIFLSRSAGYLFGSLISKLTQKCFTFHQIIFYCSVIMTTFLCLFSFVPNIASRTGFIFVTGAMSAHLDIFINMSIIEAQKNNQLDFWLQVSHGAFGVGGLIGPLFVFWFQLSSLAGIGVIFFVVAPLYMFLKSPEIDQDQKKQSLLQATTGTQQRIPLTILPKILICLMFLMMVGQQTAFGNWIASYAVMAQISNKDIAPIYGSIFWLSMTVFRFILSFLPGLPSRKLFWLRLGAIICSVTSLLLIMEVNGFIGVMFSSISLGIMFSVVFPLLLAMIQELGYKLTPSQNSDFMICASLGEGVLAVFTGYLMDFFGINMLYYSIIGINSSMMVAYLLTVLVIDREKEALSYKRQIKKVDNHSINGEETSENDRREIEKTDKCEI